MKKIKLIIPNCCKTFQEAQNCRNPKCELRKQLLKKVRGLLSAIGGLENGKFL